MNRSALLGFVLAGTAVALLALAAVALSGFGDDEGSVHEPAIDALDEAGILEGSECGEGLICPTEPFHRWVMAVWLVRALGEEIEVNRDNGYSTTQRDADLLVAPIALTEARVEKPG